MQSRMLTTGILIGCLFLGLGAREVIAQQGQETSVEERLLFLEKAVQALQERLEIVSSKEEERLSKDAILRWAAEQGHVDVLQALLNKGADVNATDLQGRTALMLATRKGHAIVVQVLLDTKAELNIRDLQGWTAADFAKESGYPLILQALLNAGARLNGSPAEKAPKKSEAEPVAEPEASEAKEQDAEQPEASDIQDATRKDAGPEAPADSEDDYNDLMRAASEGVAEKVEELLRQSSSEVNAISDRGYTALMLAVAGNYPAIAQILLEHGADLDVQTDKGYTALMIAAAEGYTDIVRGLVERGANARLKAVSGHTALEIARAQGIQEIVDILERAELMIAPGRYHVTVDGSGFTTQLPDLGPVWRKRAEEICQGREYTVIDKQYSSPGSDTQSISGVVECR